MVIPLPKCWRNATVNSTVYNSVQIVEWIHYNFSVKLQARHRDESSATICPLILDPLPATDFKAANQL